MKSLLSPSRILLALALGYAIWFALFIRDYAGNLRWAFCVVMGTQLLLAGVYGYVLAKKPVQALWAWGTVLLWAIGSAFVPRYEAWYFLYTGASGSFEKMMAFMASKPSVGQIILNSGYLWANVLVQAGAALLLVIGLLVGNRRPTNKAL